MPLIVPCHRVVRSDGAIGQYSLGGPENKRTILEAEGLDLPRLEQLASSGIRFIGSDTTKIFCLPTCRHARRVTDRHRLEFHSAAEARRAAIAPARSAAGVGGGRRLRPLPRPRPIADFVTIRNWTSQPRCLYSAYLGPAAYANARRPTHVAGAPIWLGMLVLYVVWGSTYLGIAVAVDTIPPFLMAAIRFLARRLPAGLVILATAARSPPDAAASCATAPSSAGCCSAAGRASWPSASRPCPRGSPRSSSR